MAAGNDKPDQGAAGPETSHSPINKGPAWQTLERMGLNTRKDNSVDDYQRAQIKPVVATILNAPDSAERVGSASATTAMHEAADPEIVERVRLILEAEETRQQAFMRALLGELPGWVHSETRRQLGIFYGDLSEQGFTDEQILAFVAHHEKSFVPGRAPDSIAFLRAVNYLAHVRYAVSLGPEKGLEVLYGPDASRGYRSHAAAQGPRRPKWHVAPLQECLAALAADFEQAHGHAPTLKELVREGERKYGGTAGFHAKGGAVVTFRSDAALRITATNRRPVKVQHQNLYPHLPPAIR
jgi:hypothetical protein